jgi:hypothetical protein
MVLPAVMDVFTFDDHEIKCVLHDIPNQVGGVTWSPAVQETGMYHLQDGYYSGSSLSQTSSLKIYSAQLTKLHETGKINTFTCKLLVGKSNTPVTATQTLTLFKPSKFV